MMTPEEQAQFDGLKRQVEELTGRLDSILNKDGNLTIPIILKDSDTTASGSIRIETNEGPFNVLVA